MGNAMSQIKLTETRIATFRPSREEWLKDSESRLQVRGRATGSKTYIFRSTLNYREIRITIGDVKAIHLSDARQKAQLWQGWVEEGKDPRAVLQQLEQDRTAAEAARKAQEEAAAKEALLLQAPALEAWEVYLTARTPKWSPTSLANHRYVSKEGGQPLTRGRRKGAPPTTQAGALRALLELPLSQITSERITSWLKAEVIKHPTHASLAFRLLRGFLNWCASHPDYASQTHADACKSTAVKDEIPKKRVKNDFLQKQQLSAWFEKVRQIPNPTIAAYLQIALLTGARREELAGLKWEDVQFQWDFLHIADKVEDEGRQIPLTPYVKSLLRDLKARNETPHPPPRRITSSQRNHETKWEPSPWVFTSRTSKTGRLIEPGIQHNAACIAAGLEGLTIHGLRRSFASLSEWIEVPAGVVAQIMGHKPSATAEKHYVRRTVDLLRVWHVKIEAWILSEAGIHHPPNEQESKFKLVA